ncbi:MAG: PEGA domain-containing protein [Acidobacteria bacterium]|nr:PEGA domain-containing protein [Acidobacteriota bacterium]
MKKCPQCGKEYPEDYAHCPMDGSHLGGNKRDTAAAPRPSNPDRSPASIRIRTLMFGLLILASVFILSFTAIFLYQYWKPKYGSLIIKTTPPGTSISMNGKPRGETPLTLSNILSGEYRLEGTKEGYKELSQNVYVFPYTTQNLHWDLEPITSQLTNEQLARIEALRNKLESAQEEKIFLPPPEDYNVLFFADQILGIDPANEYALNIRSKLAGTIRNLAELAYAQEDWLEAEKQYKKLALLLQYDLATESRLTDIANRIDESIKDREKQIEDWKIRAEAAIKAERLLPPENDNALDAVQNIQRLDASNIYVRETIARLKDRLQNRGDSKITAGDWRGAQNEFKIILQYFPEDTYSRTRLASVEDKIAEMEQTELQQNQSEYEKQQSQQTLSSLRRSALNFFLEGSYQESIAEWAEYLRIAPDSDEAYFYLGASYQSEKQLDSAIYNYEKCIAVNPDHPSAHLNLGMLYDYHRNNLKIAGEHLKKAMELGGSGEYTPARIRAMIQDLEDRASARTVLKTLIPVEHAHMFTSCRGNIRFTEEGVEYITAETNHGFYESYRGLRTLSLQGNKLTIKTRNETYNLRFLNDKDAVRVKAWLVSSGKLR